MRAAAYSLSLLAFFTGFAASTDIKNQHNQNIPRHFTDKKESTLMIDFTEQKKLNSWRITNDGVMGGKSEGSFLLQEHKAVFKGDISLDNNGGFSAVFHSIDLLPKALEAVTINIIGDGLNYQLSMVVNIDGYRLAYKQSFITVADQQAELTFSLADFQASFRGRNIPNAPVLQSENIREVGFFITRKTAGAFSLAIESIEFH